MQKSMTNFEALNLPESLAKTLKNLHFKVPTPIQAASIPVALEGRDLLATAQTGTGKTLAYSIPMLIHLIENADRNALVLVPTRELAVQVRDSLRQLMSNESRFEMAMLIGGEPMPKQFNQLRYRPRIVVGTPGRVNDHLKRGTLKLKDTNFLVIDEADRMLDMGFSVQLDVIAEQLPKQRQTLMFSATLPQNIIKLSNNYLTNPERISSNDATQPAPKINQEVAHTSTRDKMSQLMTELDSRQGSIIIFVKTKRNADTLSDKLCEQGHQADAIHGDLRQRQRDRVIANFRNNKSRILVATDIAARGLDIPHIMHVINYDLPQCPEDYIHRIGRTARAGMDGNSLCLITPEDHGKWRAIQRLMNPGAAVNLPRGAGGRSGGGSNSRPQNENRRKFGRSSEAPRRGDSKKPWESDSRYTPERRSADGNSGFRSERRPADGNSGFRSERRPADGNSGFRSERRPTDGNSGFRSERRPTDGNSGFRSDHSEKRPARSSDRAPTRPDDRKSPYQKKSGNFSDRSDSRAPSNKSFSSGKPSNTGRPAHKKAAPKSKNRY